MSSPSSRTSKATSLSGDENFLNETQALALVDGCSFSWSYPKLDGIGTQSWVIGSRSHSNVQGAGCGLALGGGCHNLQFMITYRQSLVDGSTFGNLSAVEQPCHCGVVNRSHLDFQLIICLAVYLGISQVGVQNTWIVIFRLTVKYGSSSE